MSHCPLCHAKLESDKAGLYCMECSYKYPVIGAPSPLRELDMERLRLQKMEQSGESGPEVDLLRERVRLLEQMS